MKTVVFLLPLIFFAICNGEEETKIVGGEELDDISDYLFVVALVDENDDFACGGTLIDSRHVITAAHCSEGISKVVVGSNDLISDGTDYSVKDFISHPDFTEDPSPANDIAVMILSEDVSEITDFPKRATAELDDYDTSCKALGKGYTGYPEPGKPSKKLKLGYVKPVPHSKCEDEWKEAESDFEVAEKTICTFSNDTAACLGDSGGPLLCNEELTGVVSYGNPCGEGTPDVFTEVYFFNDWIDSVINDN
ncbi:chymotrypsin-1-like isoform X2 [Tenebrio molitor]|uniref:chymotrypsin-1-like isoform X2 n=1 Tax=Tenebrio molitor TaxID=7067 RepID=UPI0036246DA8